MIFLRPWFLLLILVPIVFHLFREKGTFASVWAKVIDEKLLPYLLIKGSNTTAKRRSIYKACLWGLLTIALAGPAWDKVSVPTQTVQSGSVIILELSDVLQGSLLKRAQQKIYDILDHLENEQVGFVLYDKYGYTAGPLTFETNIIRDMVPFVNQSVLPMRESEPLAAFEEADKLLKNAGIEKGRVLFLTTGVFVPDDLVKKLKDYPHKIGVLGIGSHVARPIALESGGFLMGTDGKPYMFKLNEKKLSKLGAYQAMTADDSDVQALLQATPHKDKNERTVDEQQFWRDRGGLFVALTLPFFALLFRRGTAFVFLLLFCLPVMAGPWERPDQENYRKQMGGVRLYRAEKYPEASEVFKVGLSDDDLYNFGNALAFQQKIKEAIDVYKQVIKRRPDHQDAIFNKEYLEKELKKQELEKKKQEEELKQEQERQENIKKLLELQELLQQEQEKKKEEALEIQKEQQKAEQENLSEKEFLEKVAQEVKEEIQQKEQEQKQLKEVENQPLEKQQEELEKLEKNITEEQVQQEELQQELKKQYQLPEVQQRLNDALTQKSKVKEEINQALKNNIQNKSEIKEGLAQDQKKQEALLKAVQQQLEKQSPTKDYLEKVAQEVKEEIQRKEKAKQQLEKVKAENELKQKEELKRLQQQVKRENQAEQKRHQELSQRQMTQAAQKSKEVSDIQQEILHKIEQVEQKENQKNDVVEKPVEVVEEATEVLEKPQKAKKEPVFDQESQGILNHLEVQEYNVLRYRIHQQYTKKTGQKQ